MTCPDCGAPTDPSLRNPACADQASCRRRARLQVLAATATVAPPAEPTSFCHVCSSPAIVAFSQHVRGAWVCRQHESS